MQRLLYCEWTWEFVVSLVSYLVGLSWVPPQSVKDTLLR